MPLWFCMSNCCNWLVYVCVDCMLLYHLFKNGFKMIFYATISNQSHHVVVYKTLKIYTVLDLKFLIWFLKFV